MSGKGAKGLSGKGAKGTMGDKKGDKKKPISRSARAGLQFPVGRIHRLLKVSRSQRCRMAFCLRNPIFQAQYQIQPTSVCSLMTAWPMCRAESLPMAAWVPQLPCTLRQFSVRPSVDSDSPLTNAHGCYATSYLLPRSLSIQRGRANFPDLARRVQSI